MASVSSTCRFVLFASFFGLLFACGTEAPPGGSDDLGPSAHVDTTAAADDAQPRGPACPVSCDDENPCTMDECVAGACINTPNTNAPCDDHNACTTDDYCDSDGLCLGGNSTNCDDKDPCTDDTCNTVEGCVYDQRPDGEPCEDGSHCTIGDTCTNGECKGEPKICEEDDNECTTLVDCNPTTGDCRYETEPNGKPCEDGDQCTINETCKSGICVSGGPRGCTDNNPCTQDSCDPKSGCDFDPIPVAGLACDDKNKCTTNDSCAFAKCAGEALACDDGNPCTEDTCDIDKGCQFDALGAPCDDGDPCTKNDICQDGECAGKAISCPTPGTCQAVACVAGSCQVSATSGPCDDGNVCTTGDACGPSGCNGVAVSCDDGNPCTDDGCDPGSGCTHLDNVAACDDGDPCTSNDTCGAGACAGSGSCGCTSNADCKDDGNLCNGIPTCTDGLCITIPDSGVECPQATNACQESVCNPATGLCALEPAGNSEPCEDNDACTVTDTCSDGACSGTLVNCDDGNPCTDDTCDNTSGCQHVANTTPCDDGNACTVGDACSGGGCTSGAPAECTDGNGCTDDSCDATTGCTHAPNADQCDDSDPCTTSDTCANGTCVGGTAPDCDDGDACTVDSCSPTVGCVHIPNAAACDDGNACTVDDVCSDSSCLAGATELDCDDGNPCTTDGCSPTSGCIHFTHTLGCDDGNACTTQDTCKDGACVGGPAPSCDDGNPCTDDTCENGDGCQHAANADPCTDGNPCTTGDICKDGSCQSGENLCACESDADCANQEDGDLCNGTLYCDTSAPPFKCKVTEGSLVLCDTTQDATCVQTLCDPETGQCSPTPVHNGDACDDGSTCTVGDTCTEGVCVPGTPKPCDDGNLCTDDTCDATTGCVHLANASPCDDGNACTTADTCSEGKCIGGPALDCSDGNVCTTDTCKPATGCTSAANNAPCDDGDACTANDSCSGAVCIGGPPPNCNDDNACTDDSCNSAGGCVNTSNASSCDDGDACTMADSCTNKTCIGGQAPDCDDGSECTDDSCDFAAGCINAPNSLPCDDGNPCTTADTCSNTACIGGPTLVCDDGNVCTDDECNSSSGCVHAANTAPCDDGDACTVGDSCKNSSCSAGPTSLDCDDGNPCTTDSCSAAVGCMYAPNTLACNDEDACTTKDTCFDGTCVGGPAPTCDDGNPCTTDSCAANTGCLHESNAGPCDDGNACTKTDACSDGACVGGPSPDCSDNNVCTDDGCDPALGCVNSPNASSCDDGDACTTADSCVAKVCTGGEALDCDDGDPCTLDTCVAASGCVNTHAPDGAPCGPGLMCDTGTCIEAPGCGSISVVPPGYVSVPDAPELTLSSDFTVEAWVQLKGPLLSSGALIMGHDEGTGQKPKWILSYYYGFGTNSIGLAIVSPTVPYWTFTAPYEFPVGTWVHIAVVREIDSWRLFIDGKLSATEDKSIVMPAPAAPFLIGFAEGSTNNHWPGEMRQVRLSSVARYSTDFVPPTKHQTDGSAIGLWPLDDGQGVTATDLGPHGLNGTLVGPVNWVLGACTLCVPNEPTCINGTAGVCNAAGSGLIAPFNCTEDGDPCSQHTCVKNQGCVVEHTTLPCDDGDACTLADACEGGVCVSGTELSCDDGNPCTDDKCNSNSGCESAPNTAPCDDGDACTTADMCAGGTCVAGEPPDCNDNNPCTDDACAPSTGCETTNNTSPCDDGSACTEGDQCDNGSCVSGGSTDCTDGNPCTDDDCDPLSGCTTSLNLATCTDDDVCTSNDVCVDGECISGEDVVCDDGNVCTDDTCSPSSGCTYTPNEEPCDDGEACTQTDICSGNGTCVGLNPIKCDASEPCLLPYTCDPSSGNCIPHGPVPDETPCDDGNACTALDYCISGTCVSGGARVWNKPVGPKLYASEQLVPLALEYAGDGWLLLQTATNYGQLVLTKVDLNGDESWSQNLSADLPPQYNSNSFNGGSLAAHPNGDFSIAATAQFPEPHWATFRFDIGGSPIWNRVFSPDSEFGKPVGKVQIAALGEDTVLVGASHFSAGNPDELRTALAIRLDADGNTLWEATIDPPTSALVDIVTAGVAGDNIAVGGQSGQDGWRFLLGGDGYLAWQNTHAGFGELYAGAAGNLLLSVFIGPTSGGQSTVTTFHQDGTEYWSSQVEAHVSNVRPVGSNILLRWRSTADTHFFNLLSLDFEGNLAWSRELPAPTSGGTQAGKVGVISGDPDGVLIASDQYWPSSTYYSQTWLLRLDHWGNSDCYESGPCAAMGATDCNDEDPCTTDLCDAAHDGCYHAVLPNGSSCGSGSTCFDGECLGTNACFLPSSCANGSCVPAEPVDCDDQNSCTDDTCDPATGCINTPNSALCDDGDECTLGDVCVQGQCSGDAVDCDDTNECTADTCDTETGTCGHAPIAGCIPEMVPVPAGSFWMGCNEVVDAQCKPQEHPQHEVVLPAYAIDSTEVTAEQYEQCVLAGACTTPAVTAQCAPSQYGTFGVAGREQNPVNCVSWTQAKTYCNWTDKRLCTEAEWEKAARGGCDYYIGEACSEAMPKFPWGNADATCSYAVADLGCGTDSTWPVGSKLEGQSLYGALDMAGNVREWVEDCWHEDYGAAPSDGSAWTENCIGNYRVERGGSFGNALTGGDLRSSKRSYQSPGGGLETLGFRCCRTAPESPNPEGSCAGIADDASCDDGDPETFSDHCNSGLCVPGPNPADCAGGICFASNVVELPPAVAIGAIVADNCSAGLIPSATVASLGLEGGHAIVSLVANPFLCRVTAAHDTAEGVEFSGSPVALEDVIESAAIDVSGEVPFGDPDVQAEPFGAPFGAVPQAAPLAQGTVGFTFKLPTVTLGFPGVTFTFVSGIVTLTAAVSIEVDIGWFKLEHFRVLVEGDLTFEYGAEVSVSGAVPLGTASQSVKAGPCMPLVGGIAVMACPYVDLDIEAQATGGVAFSRIYSGTKYFSVSAEKWNGSSWTKSAASTPLNMTDQGLETIVEAGVELSAGLLPNLQLEILKTGKVSLKLGAEAGFDASVSTTSWPDIDWSTEACAVAKLGGKIEVIGVELASISLKLLDVCQTLMSGTICQDACPAGSPPKCIQNGMFVECSDVDGDGCTETDATECPIGTACDAGSGGCVATCSDDCAQYDKGCSGNTPWSCGSNDGDACWDFVYGSSCGSGTTCDPGSGTCVESCVPNAYASCYAGDLYYFDSCGTLGDVKEFCTLGCSSGACLKSCPLDCSGHGTCNATSGLCSCYLGYAGVSCNACSAGYDGFPNCVPHDPGCPADYTFGGTCSVVLEFNEVVAQVSAPATLGTSPTSTVVSVAPGVFTAKAQVSSGKLTLDKTLVGATPLGDYGVSAWWGGLTSGKKYVKFACKVGEYFTCVGATAMACAGLTSPQVIVSTSTDANFSCGVGKMTGLTDIYWVVATAP